MKFYEIRFEQGTRILALSKNFKGYLFMLATVYSDLSVYSYFSLIVFVLLKFYNIPIELKVSTLSEKSNNVSL